MRNLSILAIVLFGLLLCAGCCWHDACKCSKSKSDKCCGCSEKADKAVACAKCAELMAGGTGWCEECQKGFFEGKLVKCKKECKANPGGPPCEACVK